MTQSKRYDVSTEDLRKELEQLVPLLLCCNKKFSKDNLNDLKVFSTFDGKINPTYLNNLICLFGKFIHSDDVTNGALHKSSFNVRKASILLGNFVIKERILDEHLKTTDWDIEHNQDFSKEIIIDYLRDLKLLLNNNKEMVETLNDVKWYRLDHKLINLFLKGVLKLCRKCTLVKVQTLVNSGK